jgi:hemerythrin
MSFLIWQNDLDTGIDVIDAQHRRIIEMINHLHTAQATRDRLAIGEVIDELVDYTLSHFAFEEELMEEAGYTFTNAHKRVHEIFIKRVAEYRQRYQAGEDIADELKNMLSRWLINHIRGDDKAYAETIKRNPALRSRTTSSATRMAPAFLRPSPFRQRRLKQPVCREPRQTATRARGPKVLPDRPIEGDESCAMRMWRPPECP